MRTDKAAQRTSCVTKTCDSSSQKKEDESFQKHALINAVPRALRRTGIFNTDFIEVISLHRNVNMFLMMEL